MENKELKAFLDSGWFIAPPGLPEQQGEPLLSERADALIWRDIKQAEAFYQQMKRPQVWLYTVNQTELENGDVELSVDEGAPLTLFVKTTRLGALFSLVEAKMPEAESKHIARSVTLKSRRKSDEKVV